ncbi:AraC family transcriptional regulator [Clostridium sp. 'deep sea']|uniref:AraC family transcriptional regulator n=1 Tax=Clostridium sp. 'deep sea' TaxID=2779445 RepID=UPI0018965BA1|nr:AraC family transcriptional regulator [Clostridium sp. 'deep sea']QOR36406.1 AraC family transcriptional regulator [Clostridium sp. 'deep sea']
MNYIDIILRAIDYIEDHIFQENLYEKVFQHVKVSKYHFHRIFLAGTHETIANYIKKRRFTIIADRLRQTDDKVIEVAYDCQYTSHEGFTRAFKNYFSISPSRYRVSSKENPFLKINRINREFLEFTHSGLNLIPIVKICEELTLVGKRATTNLKNIQLDKVWNEFLTDCTKNDIRVSGQYAYTIWLESEQEARTVDEQHNYNLFVGFPKACTNVRGNNLETLDIDKGLYAIFSFKDDFSHIYRIYSYIYFVWLEKSGYRLGDGYVIETYSKDFSITNHTGEMSILIPIKKSNDYQEFNR